MDIRSIGSLQPSSDILIVLAEAAQSHEAHGRHLGKWFWTLLSDVYMGVVDRQAVPSKAINGWSPLVPSFFAVDAGYGAV